METISREERAVAWHHAATHNNCAQSVLLAFQDCLHKSTGELRALGAGFGMGMGGTEATCGALSGACIVLGLLYKGPQPASREMNALLQAFKKECGATLCGELKGVKTHTILCSCDDCIRCAVRELEKRVKTDPAAV